MKFNISIVVVTFIIGCIILLTSGGNGYWEGIDIAGILGLSIASSGIIYSLILSLVSFIKKS